MRNDIDKYVEYVLAQVGEGSHSKSEVISDLKERGLTEEEITYVMNTAWQEGNEIESTNRMAAIFQICIGLLIPVAITILIMLSGGNIFSSQSFFYILISFGYIVYILLKKKKFK